MKPYLITLSSHTPGMNRFMLSTKLIDVEHIAVQFEPYTNFHGYDIKESQNERPYPGHLMRHSFIPTDLDPSRYVVFCDTDDVVFQTALPELTADMYLAPENVLHRDTIWNDYMTDPRFAELLNEPVINCGMYIMKVPILYEYINFLKDYKQYSFEQLPFNLFLLKHPEYTKVKDIALLCPLYSNFDQKLVNKDDGNWRVRDGHLITCIHENGIKGRL